MAAAGGTWLRMGFLWSSIEQSPGVYYWSKLDQVVGWARERGLKILANVSYTPTWARPADCRDMMCPPADMDLYARFMGNLVRHYSRLGVKHYEVWNEPNQYFWWKPKPEPARYAEMVRKAYVQAKLADPSVTVVAGAFALSRDNESGTTMNPRTFLTGMYRAGVTGQFDALSFHPYTGDVGPADRRLLQPDHRRRPRPRRHHALERRRREEDLGHRVRLLDGHDRTRACPRPRQAPAPAPRHRPVAAAELRRSALPLHLPGHGHRPHGSGPTTSAWCGGTSRRSRRSRHVPGRGRS